MDSSMFRKAGKIAAVSTAVVLGNLATAAVAQDVTLRGANVFQKSVAQSGVSIEMFDEALNEETNGEVDIQTVHGGALLNTSNHVDGLKSGLVDIMVLYPFYFPGQFKIDGALTNITNIWADETPSLTRLSEVQLQLMDEFDFLREEYEGKNIKPLAPVPIDSYVLTCTEEAEGFDDIAGRKVRVFGRYMPILMEGADAQTVSVPGSEVYSALSTGLVECIYSSPNFLLGQSIYEVAPHILVTGPEKSRPQAFPTGVLAMNSDRFDQLSKAHQEAVLSVAEEMTPKFADLMEGVYDSAIEDYIAKGGGTLNFMSEEDLEKWRTSVPNLLEMAASDLNEAGVDGDALMARYQELMGAQ